MSVIEMFRQRAALLLLRGLKMGSRSGLENSRQFSD
jgi:hypothetical protein